MESRRNLKAEDFQLYEDGKRQEILSLDESERRSGASAFGNASSWRQSACFVGKPVFIIFEDSAIAPEYIKTSRDTAPEVCQGTYASTGPFCRSPIRHVHEDPSKFHQ